MKVKIPYGKDDFVQVEIPEQNLVGVYTTEDGQPLSNETAEINQVLDNPVGTAGLKELAAGRKNAVIAITDHSRPNIEKKVLPIMVEKLVEAGISKDQITVMIGPGSHRPAYNQEIEDMLGTLQDEINVVCHSAFESELKDFGKTSFGHPVKINKQFADSDLKIVLGTVLPHPFAGFSGGGKMISVGIASAETISSTHAPVIIDHPNTGFGIIEGNPFYLSSLEMAEMAGVDFLVNGIMDENENLFFIQAGSVKEAHLACVLKTREMFEVNLPEETDILIVSSGYPKDSNLYHVSAMGVCAVAGSAVKYPSIKEGGTMIMVSPMEDGVYNQIYFETMKEASGPAEVISRVQAMEEREPGHHRAYGVAQVLDKYKVVMAQSKLDSEIIEACHMEAQPSAQEAINQALKEYGDNARVAVLNYSHRMILQYQK